MKISEIDLDRLFTQALPGATVAREGDKKYVVTDSNGIEYQVVLYEASRIRKESKNGKPSEEAHRARIHAKDRIEPLVDKVASGGPNREAALAWVVTDNDGSRPLELVMSSLTTLREIAKEDDSPFSDNPSGIAYQMDRFTDAAQHPGVYTASIDD